MSSAGRHIRQGMLAYDSVRVPDDGYTGLFFSLSVLLFLVWRAKRDLSNATIRITTLGAHTAAMILLLSDAMGFFWDRGLRQGYVGGGCS